MQQNVPLNTKKDDKLVSSINYAKKIQDAILPGTYELFYGLRDYFLLYMPRDIIGGDFYWITRNENQVVLAVGDCTGHGIPGALLTMLGSTALNELIKVKGITKPDEILNKLRKRIIEELHNSENQKDSQDGMDMTICTFDTLNQTFEFAGANNDMLFIHNNELQEIKGDKMPIGRYKKMNNFKLKEFEYDSGDMIYLYSDGYKDQFGGQDNRKFGRGGFKDLVKRISFKDMSTQKEILHTKFINWRGLKKQVDDIIVLGAKLS